MDLSTSFVMQTSEGVVAPAQARTCSDPNVTGPTVYTRGLTETQVQSHFSSPVSHLSFTNTSHDTQFQSRSFGSPSQISREDSSSDEPLKASVSMTTEQDYFRSLIPAETPQNKVAFAVATACGLATPYGFTNEELRQTGMMPVLHNQLSAKIYSRAHSIISNLATKFPVVLFAIPKYKRTGVPNNMWDSGFMRVHGMLHRTNPPNQHTKIEWPPTSPDFSKASPTAHQLRILIDDILCETFVDIRMIPLGEDHLNGDRLFVCPLPKLPNFDRLIRSLELSLADQELISEDVRAYRFNQAKHFIKDTNLHDCTYTVRVLPYESTELGNEPIRSMSTDSSWHMDLTDGTQYDGELSKSMWRTLPLNIDADNINTRMNNYQFSWPAFKEQRISQPMFTLRDGCTDQGDALLSIGIVLRLNLRGASEAWRDSEPFLKYFDESDGTWKEKNIVREDALNGVVSHMNVRRMMFVIGDRNRRDLWIRNRDDQDFHIAFSGAYVVFPSGHLVQISSGSGGLRPKGYEVPSDEIPTPAKRPEGSRRDSTVSNNRAKYHKSMMDMKLSLDNGVEFYQLVDGASSDDISLCCESPVPCLGLGEPMILGNNKATVPSYASTGQYEQQAIVSVSSSSFEEDVITSFHL